MIYNVSVWFGLTYSSLEVLVCVCAVLTTTLTHTRANQTCTHSVSVCLCVYLRHRGTASDGAFAGSNACHFLWAQEVHRGASEVAGWQFVAPQLPAVVENFNKINSNLKCSPSTLYRLYLYVFAITQGGGTTNTLLLHDMLLPAWRRSTSNLPVDLPLFLSSF